MYSFQNSFLICKLFRNVYLYVPHTHSHKYTHTYVYVCVCVSMSLARSLENFEIRELSVIIQTTAFLKSARYWEETVTLLLVKVSWYFVREGKYSYIHTIDLIMGMKNRRKVNAFKWFRLEFVSVTHIIKLCRYKVASRTSNWYCDYKVILTDCIDSNLHIWPCIDFNLYICPCIDSIL